MVAAFLMLGENILIGIEVVIYVYDISVIN